MPRLFSPDSRIGQIGYALLAGALLLSQHALAYSLMSRTTYEGVWHAEFLLLPIRALVAYEALPIPIMIACLAFMLLAAAGIVVLSIYRANDSDSSPWLATLALAPHFSFW